MSRRRRVLLWALGALALLIGLPVALLGYAYSEALRMPVVREARVALADWPAGAPPVRVLLVSDSHLSGPDMPPERLARIVARLNALKPDLVLLAGDYIGGKHWSKRRYTAAQAVAPFTRLKAPLGVVAVLGNHDHAYGAAGFAQAFAATDIALLRNGAVRRGPLIIGGVDDGFSGHADLSATDRAMAALGVGPRLLLSHTPNVARQVSAPVDAVLAGHSHCGQIVLPLVGPIAPYTRPWQWLPCGRSTVRGTPLFVGAGLGTSIVPLRLGAPPDVWLIRFGPAG